MDQRLPAGGRRIRAAFDERRASGGTALIAYVMAGYPDDATAQRAVEAAIAAGADLVEVGVPFSDPVADGPVIATAGHAVLAAGGGLRSAVRLIRALRDGGHSVPILAMTYLNPLVAHAGGAATASAALADSGADGLIVPDLPAGEDPALERHVRGLGVAMCFLVAPNTGPQRIERAVRASTGFVYVVPLYGVTGARDTVAESGVALVRRVRTLADGRAPVAAGFGISQPQHVASLAGVADGVIVGSALVAAMRDGGAATGAAGVGALVAALASGAHADPRESADGPPAGALVRPTR